MAPADALRRGGYRLAQPGESAGAIFSIRAQWGVSPRGPTRARTGAPASIVSGVTVGNSWLWERILTRPTIVARARIASSIAKWSPMQARGPPPNGRESPRGGPPARPWAET